MLDRAKIKANEAGVARKITFIHGEANKVPFTDGHFDCVGISFAFRNLTYQNQVCQSHLAEVLRVLQVRHRGVEPATKRHHQGAFPFLHV